MNKLKISGLAVIGKEKIPCIGEIKILNRTSSAVQMTWQMFDEKNNSIATVTKEYFIGDKSLIEAEIFQLAFVNISKYRIDRDYIFSELKESL